MLNYKSLWCGLLAVVAAPVVAAPPALSVEASNYFKAQTEQIVASGMAGIHSATEWKARRPELRRQAAEMLGLDPMPARGDLKAVVTGRIEREDFSVEKICFQSVPGLYVTGDFYLPKGGQRPLPTILYVCGHTNVVVNKIRCGNKAGYQHHGIWLAQNGYACLIIDTMELGEIEGIHGGTYAHDMWWWNSRGYTPASVETWNGIRALDYLETRPEVDTNRLGITGRSGGGAYSWFVAALDDRVKVIAPVAGITDLQNYVVDNRVDGHCDCMFFMNTYRWDYPLLAALAAPRPLLLVNTDTDNHFPLDGVVRTFEKVKEVYEWYGDSTNFGLVIGPGPHKDTQNMQVPVLRWFNVYLKHEDPLVETAAKKLFSPLELRVLDHVPADAINGRIAESFVPAARAPSVPATAAEWQGMRAGWRDALWRKCFAGWPEKADAPVVQHVSSEVADGIRYEAFELTSQPYVSMQLIVARKAGGSEPRKVVLCLERETPPLEHPGAAFGDGELRRQLLDGQAALAAFYPRFTGSNTVSVQKKLRRHFMMVGQTLDGMRVWDIRRAIQALRAMAALGQTPLWVEADGDLGVDALYASLFEDGLAGLDLRGIPSSHMEGPDYLNVLRYMDIPEAAAMAAERCKLILQPAQTNGWEFLSAMAKSDAARLNIEIRK
jgi:dienelactone hydrolase